jgi:hypothetical protein
VTRRLDPDIASEIPQQDVADHFVSSSGLDPGTARRLVQEVVTAFMEPIEDYVRRRHRELKHRGLRNDEIFARIAEEIPNRPFAAGTRSQRQLRRLVYG